MKKLRPNEEEKNLFIESIITKLKESVRIPIDQFSIDDIKKEFTAVPENVNKPTVNVTASTYVKMIEMVMQSDIECSWHGMVKRDRENNVYTIYDILVFPQINSATTTTTDEDTFAEWQTELIMDVNFPIENLRMHGHSHVNMNVFSSGVDDQYQEDLLAKVEDDDYYIFIIMNKKLDICIFLYDFTQQVMFEKSDITFNIISDAEDTELNTWVEKELEEKAVTQAEINRRNQNNNMRIYSQVMFDEDDYSYFGNARPIFQGGRRNGFK